MVAIAAPFKRYKRLVALRGAIEAAHKLHWDASKEFPINSPSWAYFLGASADAAATLKAIDAALAAEAIDEGRIADAQTDADLRDELNRIQARSQAARSAEIASGRRASPPVEGQAGGVLRNILAWAGVASVVVLGWVLRIWG